MKDEYIKIGDFKDFQCPSDTIAIIVDPPYNLNKKYLSSQDNIPFQVWVNKILEWGKPAKWILIFGPYTTMKKWLPLVPEPHRILMWHRTFVLPSQHPPDWTYSLTPILVYKKEGAIWYGAKRNDRDWHDCIDAHSGMGDIMRLRKLFPKGYLWHPAVTGTSISTKLLLGITKEDDLVVDPMVGTGSILVAATRLKRRVFGFDITEKYIKFANEWIEKEVGLLK